MRNRLITLVALVLFVVEACAGIFIFLGGPASAGTDPDTMTVQQKLVLSWQPTDPRRACENRLTMLDSSRPVPAPMLWVGCVGLMSGGDGGREAGGQICVTYGLKPVNCLSVTGTLQMTPTGPSGPRGPMQTWTPGDAAYVHSLERAGITPQKLLRLMHKMGIR